MVTDVKIDDVKIDDVNIKDVNRTAVCHPCRSRGIAKTYQWVKFFGSFDFDEPYWECTVCGSYLNNNGVSVVPPRMPDYVMRARTIGNINQQAT